MQLLFGPLMRLRPVPFAANIKRVFPSPTIMSRQQKGRSPFFSGICAPPLLPLKVAACEPPPAERSFPEEEDYFRFALSFFLDQEVFFAHKLEALFDRRV